MSNGTATPERATVAPAGDPSAGMEREAGSEDGLHRVRVRGEERQVRLRQAREAYIRTEDYKARTAALARERERLAAERRALGLALPPAAAPGRPSPANADTGTGAIADERAAYLGALGFDGAEIAGLLQGPASAIVERALLYRRGRDEAARRGADKASVPPARQAASGPAPDPLAQLRARAKAGGERERAAYIIAKLGLE